MSNQAKKLHLDHASAHDLLVAMMRIWRFEARCAELYTQEKIRGFLHLYDGEEAVAVGVMHNLREQDRVVATYREHGHALARGLSMRSLMAEMFGKAEGCAGGRGGSMHLFSRVANFYGGNAIVGGGLLPPYEYKGGAYPGVGGTCAGSLASGSACTIIVTYSPAVVGVDTDTIELDYFDGVNTQTSLRDLTGTGVVPAFLTITEAPLYDYGTQAVGSTSQHTFTLDNIGGAAATTLAEVGLAVPYQFVGGTYPGTGGTCGTTLANGSQCDLVVEFSPVGIGAFNDQIQVDYFDGAALQQATCDITGNGAPPALIEGR